MPCIGIRPTAPPPPLPPAPTPNPLHPLPSPHAHPPRAPFEGPNVPAPLQPPPSSKRRWLTRLAAAGQALQQLPRGAYAWASYGIEFAPRPPLQLRPPPRPIFRSVPTTAIVFAPIRACTVTTNCFAPRPYLDHPPIVPGAGKNARTQLNATQPSFSLRQSSSAVDAPPTC